MKAPVEEEESDGNPEVTYVHTQRSLRPKTDKEAKTTSRKTTARNPETRNEPRLFASMRTTEPKPVHSLAKFTCKDYLYSPSQMDHLSYNHILLYKSLQAFPLRQNVKSFKAYQSGVKNAAAALSIKSNNRPQSAIVLDQIKYGSIREFIKRKELQQVDEAPRYYAEVAKHELE